MKRDRKNLLFHGQFLIFFLLRNIHYTPLILLSTNCLFFLTQRLFKSTLGFFRYLFFQDILVLLDTHLYILLPLQLNLLPLRTIIILLPHPTSTILLPHSLLSILRLRPTSTILPPSTLPLRPSIYHGGRYHNCLRLFRV